jgi:hypothetical protein
MYHLEASLWKRVESERVKHGRSRAHRQNRDAKHDASACEIVATICASV